MDPNGAHDDVRSVVAVTRERLGRGPDMVREIRSSVGEVGGEEKRDRIDQDERHTDREEEGGDGQPRRLPAIASKGLSDRVRW